MQSFKVIAFTVSKDRLKYNGQTDDGKEIPMCPLPMAGNTKTEEIELNIMFN